LKFERILGYIINKRDYVDFGWQTLSYVSQRSLLNLS